MLHPHVHVRASALDVFEVIVPRCASASLSLLPFLLHCLDCEVDPELKIRLFYTLPCLAVDTHSAAAVLRLLQPMVPSATLGPVALRSVLNPKP